MQMKTLFGNNLWTIDGDEVRMYGIPFRTRMTAVRLADGQVWLHSPVALTPERTTAVREIGPVQYIVCPNAFHHLFAGDWQAAFPEAALWGMPSLVKKRPDLTFTGLLDDFPPAVWADEIDQLILRGSQILPEAIFLHRASRTLILTDVIQNHDPRRDNWFWRWVKRLNNVSAPTGGVPRDLRLTMRDKAALRASVTRLLAWEFDKVVLAHGRCLTKDAHAHVARAFAWAL